LIIDAMTSRYYIIAGIVVAGIAAAAAGSYFASQAAKRAHLPARIKSHGATPIQVPVEMYTPPPNSDSASLETITLGSGCFWCTEAMFQNLRGVKSAVSGYSGGKVPNPTYEQVCTGNTGHAEVVQVTFDPSVISLEDILHVFWRTHDPTTPNRQGHDVGTQYRSAVFYHNDKQREVAEQYMAQLDKSDAFGAPIVTEITPFEKFYAAENYHQKYFDLNPNQGYCQMVIRPKVEKFNKEFAKLLNEK
jgi:methionine-S-sulfoxide reductase